MPLLRSRLAVRRLRFYVGLRVFIVLAIGTVIFALLIAGARLFGR